MEKEIRVSSTSHKILQLFLYLPWHIFQHKLNMVAVDPAAGVLLECLCFTRKESCKGTIFKKFCHMQWFVPYADFHWTAIKYTIHYIRWCHGIILCFQQQFQLVQLKHQTINLTNLGMSLYQKLIYLFKKWYLMGPVNYWFHYEVPQTILFLQHNLPRK